MLEDNVNTFGSVYTIMQFRYYNILNGQANGIQVAHKKNN